MIKPFLGPVNGTCFDHCWQKRPKDFFNTIAAELLHWLIATNT